MGRAARTVVRPILLQGDLRWLRRRLLHELQGLEEGEEEVGDNEKSGNEKGFGSNPEALFCSAPYASPSQVCTTGIQPPMRMTTMSTGST